MHVTAPSPPPPGPPPPSPPSPRPLPPPPPALIVNNVNGIYCFAVVQAWQGLLLLVVIRGYVVDRMVVQTLTCCFVTFLALSCWGAVISHRFVSVFNAPRVKTCSRFLHFTLLQRAGTQTVTCSKARREQEQKQSEFIKNYLL